MSQSNREQFNLIARKVMVLLIESCPEYRPISAEDVGGTSSVYDELKGINQPSASEAFLAATLEWLEEEGFIRGKNQYVATLKGLALYGAVPNSLQG
jgi:hypothetical protein